MVRSKAQGDFASELEFHRREWIVQRVGWAAMLLFVVAAALGLFGSGPLAHVTAGSPTTGTISYERFVRHTTVSALTIRVDSSASNDGTLRVLIDQPYLDAFDLEEITPEPQRTLTDGEHLVFEFASRSPRSDISMRLRPRKVGSVVGMFEIGSQQLQVEQFIYP